MNRIHLLLLLAYAALSGGCAMMPTQPPETPDVLTQVTLVGDGWYMAAVNTEHRVAIQTKKLEHQQVEHNHFFESGMMLTSYAHLKRWGMRFVNSGTEPVCAKANVLQVDYDVGIFDKWHVLQPMSTEHVGNITQHPFFALQKIMAYKEAKWTITEVKVIDYSNERGCYDGDSDSET